MKAIQKLNKLFKSQRVTVAEGFPRSSQALAPRGCRGKDSDRQDPLSYNNHFVLRHGLFLSLYSLIKKASGKLPWRSRTNNDSDSSSSSTSSSYSRSSASTSARGFNTTRNYIKNFRRIRILGSASLFSLGLLLLATFVPLYNVTRTEDTEAAAGTAKDSSITFTATRSTASVDLTVTSENGTFASSTDGTNGTTDTRAAFSISTTNFTGYTLTIASNNNTSALTNTNGGSLSSISSPIDESTFNTTTYNNKWGYKPNYYGSAANSNYLPSPTTTASTLDETSSANSTAKSYTIALGARADYTNASGTYSSSNYKLMYVANPVAYSISFDKGSAAETPSNMPAVVTGSVSTMTVDLPSTIPTRTAYDFIGWCLGTITTTNNVDTCSNANVYNPDGNGTNLAFGIDRESSNTGVTLHAMWKIKTYTITRRYRLQDTSGNYPSSYTADGTVTVDYGGSYTYSRSATTSHQAASTSISNVTSAQTISLDVPRKTITVTKKYRKQDTSGNYPNTYTSDGTASVLYGANYTYSRAAETGFQAASKGITNVTSAQTISLDVPRITYTCSKQYRLQKADGNWDSYTADGSSTAYYGGSCSYSKKVTDYKGSSSGTNGSEGSASASNVTSAQTLSISLYRNTYTLTVSKGTNITAASATTSAVHGTNYYRWGQGVALSATKAGNVTCTSYGTPSWTQSGTAGTFSTTSSATPTFTMGKGNATVTAASSASNVVQTVTLSRNTGANGITIAGTKYTASSVSLNCGTYNISGNYESNYEFSSWSRANGVAVANTSSASTTMTVSGAGTLTLNAKSSKLWFQNATSANCGSTMYDNRGNDTYKNIAYTTAKIGSLCWMTRNLDLPGGTALSQSDSNLNGSTTSYTLRASSTSGFTPGDYTTGWVYNSSSTYNDTSCGNNDPCYSYYSYAAATAGTNPSSGEASSDICPYGWRLPTKAEYDTLVSSYNTGAKLVASPFYGVYSGNYYDGSFYDGGSLGRYWSSTAYNSNTAYTLLFDSSSAYTDYYGKFRGYAVRCVAKS